MKFADSIFTCLCSVYIIFIIIYNIHMSPLFRSWNQSFKVFDKYKLALPLNVGFSYSDTISQWYLMYIAQKIRLLWKIRIEKTEVKMNTGIHHQMSLVIPLFVSCFYSDQLSTEQWMWKWYHGRRLSAMSVIQVSNVYNTFLQYGPSRMTNKTVHLPSSEMTLKRIKTVEELYL